MHTSRVVILISGSGSNLQAFIDAQQKGQLGGHIVGVISNKADAYGLERAQNADIPTHVIEHTRFESREAFDKALATRIKALQPDLVILAGFMRILTPQFVQTFTGKMLNIHPSLLPKYPGLHTHKRALENKDEYHGTSVHLVTEELDGGPVIAQARLKLNWQDSESDIQAQIQKLEHRLYPQVAEWFLQGRIQVEDKGITFDNEMLNQPILVE